MSSTIILAISDELERCRARAKTSADCLRGFCRWLQSVEQLAEDPWAGASVAVGRARSLPRIVPTDQLDRLLASLRLAAGVDADVAPDRALRRPRASTTFLAVALMVATGVRVNEAVSIEVKNVDVAARTLRIIGKGRRERRRGRTRMSVRRPAGTSRALSRSRS